MDKRVLWSKILAIVALLLMLVGFGLITAVGHRMEYGSLLLSGIIIAVAGAIISESSSRKLVLWGAIGTAAAMTPGFFLGLVAGLKGQVPFVHPVLIGIIVIIGGLSQIAIVGGTIGILLDGKRSASPTMSNGTGQESKEATSADPGELHSAAGIKRTGLRKGLVWGVALAAVPLLVIGISLLTRGGKMNGESRKANAEGPYFSVGSTRDEVLRIQGPPTYKSDRVWFYGDSQVQFDSEGKVNYIWDYSKNLKIKPEKVP